MPIRIRLLEAGDHLSHAVELLLALHDDLVLVSGEADVLLVDLRRPLGRAFTLLTRHAESVPVVALARDPIQARTALAHGAAQAVVKSDGPASFLAALRSAAAPAVAA